MAIEERTITEQKVLKDDVYEHVFDKVPEDKRKSLLSLTIVLAGYPIALSNFVIGGAVGVGLSITKAIIALLVGNAVLISIVVLTGLLAYRTGLSTAFLSRRAFGKIGSQIFSVLLAMSAVTWVALNGDIFSRMIKTTFPWWPLTVPITAVIVILVWMQSAIRGFKGLHVVSTFGVPAALILSAIGVFAVYGATDGFAGLFEYVPKKPITFSAATASIVGGWVFGATITPDVCRFARSNRDVIIAGIVAFVIGCFGLQLAGALVAITTGTGDFTKAMAALGLSVLAFFAAVFCLWTTQDNNIYGASLALQNVIKDTKYFGKITHLHIAVTVAGLAAIFAAAGIYSQILPVIKFLSLLIPPVPGIIMAEEFFIKKPKAATTVNWMALVAWLCGGTASYFALKANFFVPPIIGIIVAGVIYVVLNQSGKTQAAN
ncbi:thiamine permease [Clostridiales bacterium PH28_bin88]|nr:thiamine permease [Clostridiales bacterium PH28_bin88]